MRIKRWNLDRSLPPRKNQQERPVVIEGQVPTSQVAEAPEREMDGALTLPDRGLTRLNCIEPQFCDPVLSSVAERHWEVDIASSSRHPGISPASLLPVWHQGRDITVHS